MIRFIDYIDGMACGAYGIVHTHVQVPRGKSEGRLKGRWNYIIKKVKVDVSRYVPGVAQRVGRGIAVLFHDRGTRRGGEWSAARPGQNLPPGKTRYPLYRRLGGPQGRYGQGENSRSHRQSIPGRAALSQSLYRLSYRAVYY
jgi:hypothetical protein